MSERTLPTPNDEPPVTETVIRAAHLLDRDAPADYRQEWTTRIAAPAQALSQATESIVIFRLGDEWLALPAAVFQEVAEPATIHTIPHRSNQTLLGLVNVHGELLLCVAISAFLGIERGSQRDSQHTVYQRLLVANRKGSRMAFLVDEVASVYRYAPPDLQEVPATLAKTDSTYVCALLPWCEKTVGIINDEALFLALDRSFS